MAKPQTQFVITASRTDDGAPVYRTGAGSWHQALGEAAVFADEQAASESLSAAKSEERQVCDAYLMKVDASHGHPRPVTAREVIRATGPTTRLRRPDPVVHA